MTEDKTRVLIVEARYASDLADELLRGAVEALAAFGAEHEVVTVPGVLEIAPAIAMAEEGLHRPAGGLPFDGYVALGAVLDGGSLQSQIMAQTAARGLMDLAIGRRLAIGAGVLVIEDEDQAWSHARASEGDAGGQAARAALTMISLKQQLLDGRR